MEAKKDQETFLTITLSLAELFNKFANRVIKLKVRIFFLCNVQAKKKREIKE